jgi:hypothetical protein
MERKTLHCTCIVARLADCPFENLIPSVSVHHLQQILWSEFGASCHHQAAFRVSQVAAVLMAAYRSGSDLQLVREVVSNSRLTRAEQFGQFRETWKKRRGYGKAEAQSSPRARCDRQAA